MADKIVKGPSAPEDNQQDRIAKFEDLTPAAKLDQMNSVKNKFIADNRDDTARGFVEVTDISFVRQDDGKELYVVTIREIDKVHNIERDRKEFYTIDSQNANLINVRQYSKQEIEQQNAVDRDLSGKMAARQKQLEDAANRADKISMTDLERAEMAGEKLGIPKEEIDELNSYEIVNDKVKFSAEKLPSGTDSQPIKGNQLVDNTTTINDLIGKNFKYYKFIKGISGQKMVVGINDDGTFEQVDENVLMPITGEHKANIFAENGQIVQDGVAVTFAFRVRQYPSRTFGVYNRGAEYGTFYAEGASQDGHLLGVKIDNIEPSDVYPNTKRELFYGEKFETAKEAAEVGSKNFDERDELLNPYNGFLSPAEQQKTAEDLNISMDRLNDISKDVLQKNAKTSLPQEKIKEEFYKEAITYAYENDTITGNKANELAEEYGLEEDVAPNDHEPDERELGVDPTNHYNN